VSSAADGVDEIIRQVIVDGDEALLRLTEALDGVRPESLELSREEWDEGAAEVSAEARAAVAAGARVARAMEILADDAPEHLLLAGRLRLEHKQASLEELGALSDPIMTKDAVAGRIRRLLAMADKRAADQNIPDTESVVTPEMLAP